MKLKYSASFQCATLDILILASKSFTLLSLSVKLANFTLATLISVHYNNKKIEWN